MVAEARGGGEGLGDEAAAGAAGGVELADHGGEHVLLAGAERAAALDQAQGAEGEGGVAAGAGGGLGALRGEGGEAGGLGGVGEGGEVVAAGGEGEGEEAGLEDR